MASLIPSGIQLLLSLPGRQRDNQLPINHGQRVAPPFEARANAVSGSYVVQPGVHALSFLQIDSLMYVRRVRDGSNRLQDTLRLFADYLRADAKAGSRATVKQPIDPTFLQCQVNGVVLPCAEEDPDQGFDGFGARL